MIKRNLNTLWVLGACVALGGSPACSGDVDGGDTGDTGNSGDTGNTGPVVDPPIDPYTGNFECEGIDDTGFIMYDGVQTACTGAALTAQQLNPIGCGEFPENIAAACCTCSYAACQPIPFDQYADVCGLAPIDPCLIDATQCVDNVEPSQCMQCHNGAQAIGELYSGPGINNPHPFPPAALIDCTACHGGNGAGLGKLGAHVPYPEEICPQGAGNCEDYLANDNFAYFNYLTLVGIDKFNDYTVDGTLYTGLDWLQFRNPGDLRVVEDGRSCGTVGCHAGAHVESVLRSPIGLDRLMTGGRMAAGITNQVNPNDWYQKTAAEYAWRAVSDPDFVNADPTNNVGRVGNLAEYPELAQRVTNRFLNVQAAELDNDLEAVDPAYLNQIIAGSDLDELYSEQLAITCGDCHAGSAGANNRYADFRSSGCAACHMEYSMDGRSRSADVNVPKLEPANPDAIAAPERPHVESHSIRNVSKFVAGSYLRGISDTACVGCHQGSNRTVLQYWGIRLDQNQDLANNTQYPANPVTFTNTAQDARLYDQTINNNTFNGRNADQYILYEDYDGDLRDDTPPDIHYEAGLGCIDCHGAADLHGGPKPETAPGANDQAADYIYSHQDQVVKIQCETCHGTIDDYASYQTCTTYDGQPSNCVYDGKGNSLRHVTRDPQNNFFLKSRLTGNMHYVPQTRDTVFETGKLNPFNQQAIYNQKASYAMGRINDSFQDGQGPVQADPLLYSEGFTHLDTMDCTSCHASWTNNCVGCHLHTQYDDDAASFFYSNITGERINLFEANADFVYQSPVPFYLGVNSRNKITKISPAEKVFYRYTDFNNDESNVYVFSDRNGNGNNPNFDGRGAFGASGQNQMAAHSIRGKVDTNNEGGSYCAACHFNADMDAAVYAQFYDDYANQNFANFDFNVLQAEIGLNPGNQNNTEYWIHMVCGFGSGLYFMDANGCPVNPLDAQANREYCDGNAPADIFDLNNVAYDLDRVVEANGVSNVANNHPMLNPGELFLNGAPLRNGALFPALAGPLGTGMLNKLCDPNQMLILDAWLDANGDAQGEYDNVIQ